MKQICYGDRERMEDLLASQKWMAQKYNEAASQVISLQLQSELMNLLHEEHRIHQELLAQMQKRGWMVPQAADHKQVQQLLNQWTNKIGDC